MTLGTGRGHIMQAFLDAIGFQIRAILETLDAQTGTVVEELLVGGGVTASNAACQIQADLSGVPILRPTRFAQEQYHAGMLAHDGHPAQGLRYVLTMVEEHQMMEAIASAPLAARVALLFRYDDLWAMELQPRRAGFDYLRHLFLYYKTLTALGVAVDFVADASQRGDYKLAIGMKHSTLKARKYSAPTWIRARPWPATR